MYTKQLPISLLTLIVLPALLSSCSSPPALPTVDESLKRPANSAMAVDLQTCKSDLHNTRIQANESNRLADLASATLAGVSARQQAMASAYATAVAAAQARTVAPDTSLANTVFTVSFDFGSTRVVMPAQTQALVGIARSAPLVVLRGQADGAAASPSQRRINQQRVAAVRDHLVAGGVDAVRIRTTFEHSDQPIADHPSGTSNDTKRRVEVEVYRVMPVAVIFAAATSP
jgi:outer membrane protein OmpA-like peptidoglycan-associated protein